MSVEPITWKRAEQLAGRRLDRRRRYAWDGDELLELARWTVTCAGCSCDCGDGYGCSHGACGCDECGYTGKRRVSMWLPAHLTEHARAVEHNLAVEAA